jgi:hypothetical protein
MTIIPQNWGFVQVCFSNQREKEANLPKLPINFNRFLYATTSEAHRLYDLQLNVFPLPYGAKAGYEWRRLQYTRLKRHALNDIVAGDCNLAIMCGRTSQNLFVLDCESPDALLYHMQQAKKRRIPLWVVKTARGGHLYFRCADGEVHNISNGTIANTEVRGRNGYVLAPPSLHPTGVKYQWFLTEGNTIPVVNASAINWLRDSNNKPIHLKVDQTFNSHKVSPLLRVVSPYSNLSKTTLDYIKNGHALPEGTRNNRLFAAACDMLGNGYSEYDAYAVLQVVAVASGLGAYEIENTLKSASGRQRTPSRPQSEQKVNATEFQQWKFALIYASQRVWEGRTATNERALWLALVERARLSTNQHGVFRASLRELACLSRMGINTVQKLLRKLLHERKPMVFKVGEDAMSGATLWRFSDIVMGIARDYALKSKDECLPTYWLNYADTLIHSDIVERGAVGKGAMFLYYIMKDKKLIQMPSQLALSARMTVNQVNYALLKLREFGLVKRTRMGWCVCEMTLAEIQANVFYVRPQVWGRGEKRRRLFARQREKYVSRLMVLTRLRREGDSYIKALTEGRPQVLCVDDLCDEIREVLDDPIADLMFAEGAHCTTESGFVLIPHRFEPTLQAEELK